MNTKLANKARICSYGTADTLWFCAKRAGMHDPNRWTRTDTIGRIEEYIIDGKVYKLVTSLPKYDVVLAPDRTYAFVNRKTKTLVDE